MLKKRGVKMKRILKKSIALMLFLSYFVVLSSVISSGSLTADEKELQISADLFPEVLADRHELSSVERLKDREELNTLVYRNADDTETLYWFAEDVKYIDEDGRIQDKSNKIISQGKSYSNTGNDIRLSFPREVYSGVALEYKDIKISIAPLYTEKTALDAKTEKRSVASHDKAAERVVYPNVFGRGTELVYTPTFSGFKEDIIIHSCNGLTEYTFIMYTNGLRLDEKDMGLYDKEGEHRGYIGSLVIFDAAGDITEGKYRVKEISENEKYSVTYIIDGEWLKNAEYPVDIDPTFTVTSTGSGSSKTILDATIYNSMGTSFNTGTSTYNIIGNIGASSGMNITGSTLMKFPGMYKTVLYNMIPNESINYVRLSMYNSSAGYSSTATVDVYPYYEGNWTESGSSVSGLTPGYYSRVRTSVDVCGSGWYTFDITNHIREFKKGTYNKDYGLIFYARNQNQTTAEKYFCSTESASMKPSLIINYTRYTSYNIVSTYSNRFKNAYSNSYTIINDAHNFVNVIFNQFGASISCGTITNKALPIDSCRGGFSTSCSSAGCGSHCYNTHHRNVFKLFDNIYNNNLRQKNTIYVEWYYMQRATLCKHTSNGGHVPYEAMGLTCTHDERATRGINPDQSIFINNALPAVEMLSLAEDYDLSAVSAKYILAHEFMHVMGIFDTYDYQPGHQWNKSKSNPNDQICIMGNYSSYYGNFDTYHGLIELGRAQPFCTYCYNLINSVFYTKSFPGWNEDN